MDTAEAKDLLLDTAHHHLATEAAHRAPAREADTVLLPATTAGDTEHRGGRATESIVFTEQIY